MSCARVRRRLPRAYDRELPVDQQIEVDAHVQGCARCAAAMEDLRAVREAFGAMLATREPWPPEEHASLHANIVSRAGVEDVSWPAWLRDACREAHFVYAGLGAVGATVVCLMIMSSMLRFAALVVPGSNQNPVVVDARMLMPRVIDNGFDPAANARSDDEAAFTLSGVVTREGRLVNLELHPEGGRAPAAGTREAEAVEHMMGAMARARFAPARVAGLPIAVNMVWLVEHTTVHGVAFPVEPTAVQPPVKKRRAAATEVVVRPAIVA